MKLSQDKDGKFLSSKKKFVHCDYCDKDDCIISSCWKLHPEKNLCKQGKKSKKILPAIHKNTVVIHAGKVTGCTSKLNSNITYITKKTGL